MKSKILLIISTVVLSACASHFPVTGQTSKGEQFEGEAVASMTEGTFHIVSKKGTTCDGTYDQWSMAASFLIDVSCSDGRHGKILATRDPSLVSGTGEGKMNDGTKFTFAFGDRKGMKP